MTRSFRTGLLAAAFACAPAAAQVTALRINDLDLRDPHVFVNPFGSLCVDLTDTPFAGFSVNGQLQTAISGDTNPADGFLDLSTLLLFDPLDQGAALNAFDAGSAACVPPAAAPTCSAFTSIGLSGQAALSTAADCMAIFPGLTHGYTPGVATPTAPCFVSPAGSITLDLGTLVVPLETAEIGARFVGNPATSTDRGLIRGFLRESVADTVPIPANIPLIGGLPLSSVLPGGTGNCAMRDDRESHNGASGWWFYLNFTAVPVDHDFASSGWAGFGNGFE
jgi:hypothetical protein